LLDIGCGRCDLYAVARELAALNNDIVLYNAIDHNPLMTQLGEEKWGLTDITVGAFETAKFNARLGSSIRCIHSTQMSNRK
jgi:hypothetical protein